MNKKYITNIFILILFINTIFFSCNKNNQNNTISNQSSVSQNAVDTSFNFEYSVEPISEWDLQDMGFYQKVVSGTREYFINQNYTDLDSAIKSIEQNEINIDKLHQFLRSSSIDIPKLSATYYISGYEENNRIDYYNNIKTSIIDENSLNCYIELLFNMSEKWVNNAIQSAIEKAYINNNKTSVIDFNNFSENLKKDLSIFTNFDDVFFSGQGDVKNLSETLSQSFGIYLYDNYDLKSIFDLYNHPFDFQSIFKKTFQEEINSWIKTIGLTTDELENYQNYNFMDKFPSIDKNDIAKFETNLLTQDNFIVHETAQAKYYFETNYLTTEEMFEFVYLNEKSIKDIKNYIGEKYVEVKDKLEYQILSGQGSSQALNNNTIVLLRAKEKASEYSHETTHVITGYYNPLWLSEGLATYFETLFGSYYVPPNFQDDLDKLSKIILFEKERTEVLYLSDDIFYSSERSDAYIIAGSIVKYIDENYGTDKLMQVYTNFNNIESILGISFEQLKSNWLESLSK